MQIRFLGRTTHRSRVALLCAAAALTLGLAAPPVAAQSDDPEPGVFERANAAEAQRIFQEATIAYEEAQWVRAAALYTQITVMPLAQYLSQEELLQAEQRLADARVRGGLTRTGPAGEEAQLNTVAYQRVLAEVRSLMSESRAALDAGDPDRAKDLQSRAITRWENAFRRGVMGEAQYDSVRTELETLDSTIRQRRTELIQAQNEAEAQRLGAEAQRRERQAEDGRRNRVEQSLVRLRALQAEGRYEEALSVIDEVLFIDPVNPTALLMRNIIEDILIYKEFRDAERDNELSLVRESLALQTARRIPTDIVEFPDDWEPLSERRTGALADDFTDSPENLAVYRRLSEVQMPGEFDRTNFADVLRFISSVANVNIDPDWESMQVPGVERDTEVTLDIGEKSALVVLERVLDKVSPTDFEDDFDLRIDYAIRDGVIVIAPKADLLNDAFIVIYDVKDIVRPLIDFNTAPELSLDQILGGQQGGGSPFEDADDDDEPFEDRDDLVDETITELEDIIRAAVDPGSWDVGPISFNVFNQNLIITQTAKNHRSIRSLLRQLREIRNIQITVETRILQISQDFFEQIGFDVDVTFNAQNEQFGLLEAQQQALNGTGAFPVQGSGVSPGLLVGQNGRPVGVGANELTAPGFVPDPATGAPVFNPALPLFVPRASSGNFGVIPVQQNGLEGLEDAFVGTSGVAGAFLGNPAISLAGTFFDDIQVDFLIQATQADNRSTILTAPRLTFTNGHQASLFVGGNITAVTAVTAVTNASAVAFDPTVTPIPFGVSVVVEGFVSADRRFVTLLLDLQIATPPDLSATATTTAAVAGSGEGGGDAAPFVSGTFSLPQQEANLIRTSVTVPDKGTLLLGGQRVSTEVEVESGVPVLSSIPVLNRFFTNRITEQTDSTLLVLVKPTIIIMGEEEERNFPGLQDRLSRNINF